MDYSQEATITVKVNINCYSLLNKDQVKNIPDFRQLKILEILSVESVADTCDFIG
jgi:hypothetical protein